MLRPSVLSYILKSCVIVSSLVQRLSTQSVKMSSTAATSQRMMKAIHVAEPGPPTNMILKDLEIPILKKEQIMIKVHYSAVNRADLLQRMGKYPVPPGESQILGLEVSGTVADTNGHSQFTIGQHVMALLGGGGYAQYVAVHKDHVIILPEALSLRDAAALPEAWLTAYMLLHKVGNLQREQTCLIHAGASGVGTAAIQLVKLAGGQSMVTAGSAEKLAFCSSLGANKTHNYKQSEKSFEEVAKEWTNTAGVNMVLDCIGGDYWSGNANALAIDGHWVFYGMLGGAPKLDGSLFVTLLGKRIHIRASTLRSRTDQYKKELIQSFSVDVLPHFLKSGSSEPLLKPVIDSEFKLSAAAEAHQHVAGNKNLGKVLLNVIGDAKDEL